MKVFLEWKERERVSTWDTSDGTYLIMVMTRLENDDHYREGGASR